MFYGLLYHLFSVKSTTSRSSSRVWALLFESKTAICRS